MPTGPITYGLTGLLFSGLAAESGIVVISVDITPSGREKEVLDNNGNIIGIGTYAFKKDYRVTSTFLSPAANLANAGVGTEITLANINNGNGISGGHVILKTPHLRFSNEDFVKYDFGATQYPQI